MNDKAIQLQALLHLWAAVRAQDGRANGASVSKSYTCHLAAEGLRVEIGDEPAGHGDDTTTAASA